MREIAVSVQPTYFYVDSKANSIADWQRALDDLQSVGQSTGYLQDLEVDKLFLLS